MAGVNIDPYTTEVDGVKWTASWNSEGHISYQGVDKDGKEVTSAAPSDVMKAAHDYGVSFRGKEDGKSDGKSPENKGDDFKDTCDGLVIETNKDGTLKSANIPEANWTPRQREFVEKCLRAAAMSGNAKEAGGKNAEKGKEGASSAGKNNMSDFGKICGKYGARKIKCNPKTGEMTAYDRDGKKIEFSKEDYEVAKAYLKGVGGNGEKRSLKEELKAGFERLAKGNAQAIDLMKEPFRMTKDLYKGGKLLAQGRFRELRDRAALRIHDNIEALGLLSDNMQKRINDANKRIEERLGIENREKNPSVLAKIYGKPIKDIKRMFNRLSGRTGVESVKSVRVASSGRSGAER